jgi:hypothetical protein
MKQINIPDDALIVFCDGLGVDSMADKIALRDAGITPHLSLFADVGGEKPETIAYLAIANRWARENNWPETVLVRKITTDRVTYENLTDEMITNEVLPGLAFGMKTCSIKWKQGPQDKYLMGCASGPNKCDPHPLWLEAKRRGIKITKILNYDSGKADIRRSNKLIGDDANFNYVYPLQQLGWTRPDCLAAIIREGLPVPIKSACFFCPASQKWELWWLAGMHPDLFEKALQMEATAITGHNTRFDKIDFGVGYLEVIDTGKRWPSTKTTVGLGRSFSWNHWARMNKICDRDGIVMVSKEYCLKMADKLRGDGGNAVDTRTC